MREVRKKLKKTRDKLWPNKLMNGNEEEKKKKESVSREIVQEWGSIDGFIDVYLFHRVYFVFV